MRRYLGDGVYAEFDGYMIILTVPAGAANNGRDNVIYMEPGILTQLNEFVKEAKA